MWSLASWVRGKGRDEEKAKTARQPDMAEGQRQPRVTGYSPQRKKAAQLSPKASETVGVVGTPHRQQQVEDAELPWERVEHEDLQKLQQQVPEPRTESGTDLQVAKKKPEEYRNQRDAARMEVKSLREQLAQSKADVEQGGRMVAQCERRIHELEAEVSNMNAKHETHIKQLKQEFECIVVQKDEISREAVARARMFGGDPNASAQRQLEASYQTQIRQKEREFHDRERYLLRRQQHYVAQISQLEDSRETAKMREGELRAEMERLKADHQSQLHKLCGSMPDSSLDDASRCPSNPIVCKPSSTDVELTGGAEHSSVNLRQYQRVLSREQIDIDPAELAGLGARERRTVQRKLQQLKYEVIFRDVDIKTLSDQLELKEKRITALNRAIEVTRKTTEKGLRHLNEDSYLDQLTELTGQLSALDETDRAQKNELVKLHVKVKEAEVVVGQLDGVVEQMSELESQNQALKQQLQKQGVGEAQQSGGEITYQSYNQGVMAELKRLQPLEAEVQRLQKDLTEAEGYHKEAIKLESQVLDLITRVSEKEKEVSDLQSAKLQLEARIMPLPPRDVEGEIARMREQLLVKEEELTRLMSERVDKTGGQKAAEEATRLKIQLDLKEKDNLKLRSQVASLAALASADKPTPKPRTKDTAADQTADQPPPLDPPTDVEEIQRVLQEKEATIAHMGQQLQHFEKTASELTKLVDHTRRQSQVVRELRQQLARAEGEQSQLKMEKDNLSVAKDSIQDEIGRLQKSCTGKETALIATQHENSRLKEQMDQMKRRMDLLKVEKEQFEGRSLQLDSHLRHLKATMHQDQDQRMAATVAKLDEVVKERDHHEQKALALMAKFENTNQEMAWSRMEMTRLTTDMDQLRREKADLQGELEAHTAQTFQEDFEQERKDLKRAHSQVAEIEGRYQHQLQSMVTQLNLTAQDLQKHKETLATTETLLHSQIEHLSERLSERDRQVAAIAAENDQLQDKVLSKMLQLKQYKKQVDQYREEVEAHKQCAEMQIKQDELAPYKIESFSKLEVGVSKGSGSFGSIHLIEVNGVPCIAKRLHDILVGRGRAEAVDKVQKQSIEKKFRGECVFLSRLRHPNIVQFMGVHYGQDPSDLTLIMECLPMDLEKCLHQYPNLPLSIKISILLDVSYGLLHLHSQTPPIIHRDLTAANILLTSDMKAKIADLGVSKILDLHPLHEASQTAGPGAFAYMPPEALKRVPAYDTKLDDFSFGVVALYVANQEFPMVEEHVTVEAVQKKETHIEKRREWVDRVGKSHPLYELITSCLQDVPDKRPTTSQINAILKQLSKCHPRRFQDIMEMNQHFSRLKQAISELQSQASVLKKIAEEV